jgi:hypothetical protein
MTRIRDSRPSPAIIVAVLVLVAALAGTAVAEEASTSAKPVTKKKVKKIAKKQINKLAPGLSVAHADTADSATRADTADNATNATNATNANTATNAINAANANTVDGADVCNGTVRIPDGESRTLCSSGPIRVTGACAVSGSATASISVATSQNGAWYMGAENTETDQLAFGETFFTTAESPDQVAATSDSSASPTDADAIAVHLSMGHSGGSINGRFSPRANLTGTDQGSCRFANGAIAG